VNNFYSTVENLNSGELVTPTQLSAQWRSYLDQQQRLFTLNAQRWQSMLS
jgi:hypothetical protein